MLRPEAAPEPPGVTEPFTHLVKDVTELRAELYPEPGGLVWDKEVPTLDDHCREFLARSPFMLLATSSGDGRCDVSPRGGPPGFVRVLDETRLAFADLTGNRRIDSLRNVAESPRVGMLFLLPGFRETLRVNGRAYLTRDPEVLRACDVPGRTADLAVGVAVEKAFLHCAKALIRSKLWEPASWPARESLPSAARILYDHVQMESTSVEAVDDLLEDNYRRELW
jgi:PPOX class probable FMN-dependent enzyme